MSHMAAIHPACKVKNSQVVPVHTMKAYGENRGTAPLILNLALGGGECLGLCFGHFILPGRNPSTYWIGGWMVPRAILDTLENRKSLSPTGILIMNYSACSLVTLPTTVLQLTSVCYGLWYVTSHILLVLFKWNHKRSELLGVLQRAPWHSHSPQTADVLEMLVCMIVHITTTTITTTTVAFKPFKSHTSFLFITWNEDRLTLFFDVHLLLNKCFHAIYCKSVHL
jgi:hypothetical protein